MLSDASEFQYAKSTLPSDQLQRCSMRQFLAWLCVAVFILLVDGAATAQDALTWTDATGKFEIVATFCGVKDGNVFLQNENGKVVEVPIGKLSGSSRAQAKTLYLSMPTIAGSGETLSLNKNGPSAFDIPSLPEKDDDRITPRSERWVINIQARNASEIAALLDSFHMEIGVIGGGVKGLQIVSQLSAAKPAVVTQLNVAKEVRLYFMQVRQNEIQKMQRELAAKAGVETEGRAILTFVPETLENVLAYLESQHGKRHGASSISMIKQTIFEIRFIGGQPTLAIVDIQIKNGAPGDQ